MEAQPRENVSQLILGSFQMQLLVIEVVAYQSSQTLYFDHSLLRLM